MISFNLNIRFCSYCAANEDILQQQVSAGQHGGTGRFIVVPKVVLSHKTSRIKQLCDLCGACVQALEELGNGDFSPDTRILYGSTLCLRYNLARVQLILGLCDTIHDTVPPVAGSEPRIPIFCLLSLLLF